MLKLNIAVILLINLIGGIHCWSFSCNLQTGVGCFSSSPYVNFTYIKDNSGGDSCCRRSYQVQARVEPGNLGIFCRMSTVTPYRYTYSFAHTPNAVGENANTAYMYGYGYDVRIWPRTSFSVQTYNNFWYYNNVHAEGASQMEYRFHDQKLAVLSVSGGVGTRNGHPYLFTPTSGTMYIGLNRRYADQQLEGTGLCRIDCFTSTSFQTPQGVQGGGSSADTDHHAPDNDIPPGNLPGGGNNNRLVPLN